MTNYYLWTIKKNGRYELDPVFRSEKGFDTSGLYHSEWEQLDRLKDPIHFISITDDAKDFVDDFIQSVEDAERSALEKEKEDMLKSC